MTQIRTPEGYQDLGTQSAFTGDGEIAPGTAYASVDAAASADVTLPAATAIGGATLIVENLSAVNTINIVAAAGETVNGGAAVLAVPVSTAVLIVRSGPTALRLIEL